MNPKKLPKKIVIDVRRPDEFKKGHSKGSLNIPLQEMEGYLEEIKNINRPIVLVCGGGARHIKAYEFLKAHGIETEKGGSWNKVVAGR